MQHVSTMWRIFDVIFGIFIVLSLFGIVADSFRAEKMVMRQDIYDFMVFVLFLLGVRILWAAGTYLMYRNEKTDRD